MVKKAADAVPNIRLRAERERHGWSQANVAKSIEAAKIDVSRWERGATFPYPYFRQRLCALFGKSEEELGLARHTMSAYSNYTLTMNFTEMAQWQRMVMPPDPPPCLIGRDDALAQLQEWLCAQKHTPFTAMYGLPGVGKTTLATAIAHDEAIRRQFPDGILWASIGPQPDTPTTFHTPEERTQILRNTIGTRHVLLILDDVWRLEDAAALTVGGPNCAYLLTTRSPTIALRYANNRALMVRELSDEDSVALLRHYIPDAIARNPERAAALVRAVGGLPLALQPDGESLQEHIREATLRSLPTALHDAIALSDQHLSEQGRAALRALSVFPPKPDSFSEEAALAVTALPTTVLDELTDAGLLEGKGPGRYTLPRTIAAYGSIYRDDPRIEERLTAYENGE